ncbi:MAG TPA: hypothetical protein VK616_14090, partial [Flavitalea sp.]|nr:hypothetical protein [Flavitalea sp.]
MLSKRFKEHCIRIEQILGAKFSDTSRRMATLDYYKTYLARELKFPVEVCGREDFYLLGPGDKR